MRIMGWVVGAALVTSVSSFAGVTSGAGTWKGFGAKFDRNGSQVGEFAIEMVSEAVGKHELKSKITVTIKDHSETHVQTLKDSGNNGFDIESDHGEGGGYCFGKGLCEAYMGTQTHGFAITIIMDGPDSRRMLVTELENGNAVNFIRESLERLE